MNTHADYDHIPHAIYKQWPGVPFGSNPLAEALPLPFSPLEIVRMMREGLSIDDAVRSAPFEVRRMYLSKVSQLYEPLDRDVRLVTRLQAELCESYLARPRADPQYFNKLLMPGNGVYPRINLDSAGGYFAPTVCMWGVSGAGKTSAINRALACFPQAIRHARYGAKPFQTTQLVWLKVDCPTDGSPKTLYRNFFVSFDSVLGTDCTRAYGARASAGDLLEHVANRSKLQGLGILVIDDVENLSIAKSGGSGLLASSLYGLATKLGAVIVFVGTPEAANIVGGNVRQLRRGSQLGYTEWDPLDNGEFDRVLKSLFRCQVTNPPTRLTKALSDVFYHITHGLPALMRDLFKWAQERALELGRVRKSELLTPELVASVAHDNMQRLQAGIEQLRARRSARPVSFPDL